MRYALTMVALALLLALAAFPEPVFALSCGKPPTITVGQCSKTNCSKAFVAKAKWLGDECATRTVVSELEPGNPEMGAVLTSSSMLTDTEQLVLFVTGRACWRELEKNNNREPYYFSEHSTMDPHCYFLLTGPSVDTSNYKNTHLGKTIQIQNLTGKSYEEILSVYRGKERMDFLVSAFGTYIIPLVLLPLFIWLAMLWIRKTVFSSLHWVFKILLAIPPILFHLFVLAYSLLGTEYSYITHQAGPPLFMIGMYLYYLFRPRKRR